MHIDINIIKSMYRCTDAAINVRAVEHACIRKLIEKMASDGSVVAKNTKGKSPVWEYFGFEGLTMGAINRKKVLCQLCHTELSFSGNTTNL